MTNTNSEVLTIMFVDLTSYTEISEKLNRDAFDKMHDVFNELCKPTFSEYSGNLIKKIGDAFLVTFKSATDALLCAIKLQKKFKNYNKENNPKTPMRIKIAVHTGEVLLKENDVYGEAVNTASRLIAQTPSTNIYFTKAVFFAMNKNEIPFSFVGLKHFKGIKNPVHVSKVNWISRRLKNRFNKNFKSIILILLKLALVAGLIYLGYLIVKSIPKM